MSLSLLSSIDDISSCSSAIWSAAALAAATSAAAWRRCDASVISVSDSFVWLVGGPAVEGSMLGPPPVWPPLFVAAIAIASSLSEFDDPTSESRIERKLVKGRRW